MNSKILAILRFKNYSDFSLTSATILGMIFLVLEAQHTSDAGVAELVDAQD
jgi:hypothetical protein